LLVSSFVESQAVSFFITVFVLASLWFFDNLAEMAGAGSFANALRYVSFQTRLTGFWRGLIDTRDVVFFLTVTAISLVISFRALERRKWA
jgi:ABC-2 type transport system permease protein